MGPKKDRGDDGPPTKPKKEKQPKDEGGKSAVKELLASLSMKGDAPVPKKAMAKAKVPMLPKTDGYYDMDLPPSDEEDDEADDEAAQLRKARSGPAAEGSLVIAASAREDRKKREKEEALFVANAAAKKEALEDDANAFVVRVSAAALAAASESHSRDIKVDGFSVSAKGKELLRDASLTIAAGRRYGLVGPNGKGKSTLLRLLARREIPVPDFVDVLLVEQEVAGDDRTALEAVVAADVELAALRAEEAALVGAATTAESESDSAGERLAAVYERMQLISAASAEARASKILAGLGFTPVMQGRRTRAFSGGWRMRISLARALFIKPTLLLLDEPTNHLDLRAVIWLEEYLLRWKKTLVVVSHDRSFLDTVCTDIIHLHEEKLYFYRGKEDDKGVSVGGAFSLFEEMYEQRRREVNKNFEKFEKQMKQAKQSGSKAKQEKVADSAKYAEQKKAKARGGTKAGEDDDAAPAADLPSKWNDYNVKFEFPAPTELPPPLIQAIDVGFKYPGRDDFGLEDVNVGIDMGTRVAIVGPNGAGKSTLLNLLAGDIEPNQGGEVRRSHKLRVGRYSQHFVDVLQMDENPVQYLLRLYPQTGLPPERMRAMLGKYGLSGHNHLSPIMKLSGGQKARVVFASLNLQQPHILLLDEPTNHLDMQSIDALADALEAFPGGVVLVSHDARLIQRVCDDAEHSEVWVVDDGRVTRFDGTIDDYRSAIIKEIAMDDE